MAVPRTFSRRCVLVASPRPSIVARATRQLHDERISIGTCGRFFIATNLNLKASHWRFLGVKGSRTATSKSTFCVRFAKWKDNQNPYETLDVTREAEEEEIKSSYRRLAKQFHPDVYNNKNTGGLKEGESPEAKFVKIQAAYELLMDKDQRRQYDIDHRVNPMQASEAWMEWVLKKKKAFEQRGDMAASVWAEQQHREMSLKARRLAKQKMDPEEEKRILAREKLAMSKTFTTALNRHTLVLKKRELIRKRDAEAAKRKLVQQFLAEEGLELDDEQGS